MSSEETTLASLPHDIIRRIVREDGVSLLSISLISHSWTSLVREYREHFPILEAFQIWTIHNGNLEIHLSVSLVDTQYLKKYMHTSLVDWDEYRYPLEGCYQIRTYISLTDEGTKEEREDDNAISMLITRVFFRFRSIRRFGVRDDSKRVLDIIGNSLHPDIKIDILILNVTLFSEDVRTFTLQLMKKTRTLKELEVNSFRIVEQTEHMRDFLLGISKLTPVLYIHQSNDLSSERIFENLLAFWQSLVNELIENGMTRVKISLTKDNVIIDESSALAQTKGELDLS